MPKLFAGIDFGTSNSTVSLADQTRSWLIPLEGDEVTLPSAVFWEQTGPRRSLAARRLRPMSAARMVG